MMWVWVMAFKTINILISYLLIYNHGLIFSLAADDAANLTSLADKRVAAGFISIDCGMTEDSRYDSDRGLYYKSDSEFINTGTNIEVAGGSWTAVNTLRSFPDGLRNCYTLRPLQGKNRYYLIRAMFYYGNYDNLNTIPSFDIYIGVNLWKTLSLSSADDMRIFDVIYAPSEDLIYVCLVKTGPTIPFISTLELKPLNDSIYNSSVGTALFKHQRKDVGIDPSTDYIRTEDDPYDRLWMGISDKAWSSIKSDQTMDFMSTDPYELPPSVLQTAAIPVKNTIPLNYNWEGDTVRTGLLYVYWHFAEIQKLGSNESREFTISIPGKYQSGIISLKYLQPLTIVSPVRVNGAPLEFSIVKTNTSKLPPILNAFEIYEVLNFSALATDQNDVNAIMNIKTNYTVPASWLGDPCLPAPLDGLECSDNDHNSPRITSLNLSSNGLAGDIPHSLSALTALTYLDLSYNDFTGVIPDFLAKLPSLHTIDLRYNMLTGSIPVALSKKAEDGSLKLRLEGNPNLCMSNHCKKKNSKTMVALTILSVIITTIAAIVGVLIYMCKKRKLARFMIKPSKLKIQGFTYSEVNNMTNNFQTIIGKGGSGAVYQGYLKDGTPVVVKMLCPSSTVSLKLFRTECELLTRFHHRNLVSLIGCCEEGTTMALIYEYLANGNLQQYLSDVEKNVKVLSWRKRLQIARDAAQGLEYMHNGCKPPIVHRDMKTSNILLDENLNAKISDFGICKTFSTENIDNGLVTKVRGTYGYVDPEYYNTRRLNSKSDVFSFGVVLLELITGHPTTVKGEGDAEVIHIIAWTAPRFESGDIDSIVDKRLEGQFSTNSARKDLETAMMCVSSTAIQRPSMNQVLVDLNECLAIEMSQGREEEIINHEYSYPMNDTAIADTSIEMGPSAR